MQPLTNNYLIELARQMAFLSAFLGGFAATFLATLLMVKSSKRVAGLVIGFSATAACSFVVAVLASVMLISVLHPEAPTNISVGASIESGRIVSTLGFVIGVFALLTSVGLSGWVRSRQTGISTSAVAIVGMVFVSWAIGGFG